MSDHKESPLFKSNFMKPLFESNLDKTSTLKSRHLSATQLFDILQCEYIVCELRSKIYPLSITNKEGKVIHPREYWKSLMEKKKAKIIDLAQRNGLFSIFDDERVMADFRNRIIPEIGFPKFIYKDDNQRLLQEKWDIHNYYSKGSPVKTQLEGGKSIQGLIRNVDLTNKTVLIVLEDASVLNLPLEDITRVL